MRIRLFLCIIVAGIGSSLATGPIIRVHSGKIDMSRIIESNTITSYIINNEYTFEIYLDDTLTHDYMVDSCYMNDRQIIGQYGCVQCGQCVERSIETESYNKPGAVKRTLVYFRAQSTQIIFKCNIRRIQCSGCAERSCQRHPSIALSHFLSEEVTVMYPPNGYVGNFPMPIPPPNSFPTPFFGRSSYEIPQMPPNGHTGIGAAPPAAAVGSTDSSGLWPWWVWLLILLLLLLLLCCLLALCLAAWLRKRKAMKKKETIVTTTTIGGDKKECGTGTEKVSVHCVGTDTKDIVKIQPAMVLGAEDLAHSHHHHQHQHMSNSRSRSEAEEQSIAAGGSYSLREGHIHEGYTRTTPKDSYHDRYATRDRYEQQLARADREGRYADRSSYRNFAYERDMGRVEPLDGYDEVETREKTYCLSDDEGEIVEKDVKRTHTTRFVQETREYDGQEERFRGDEHHHAHYTHSLPV